MSERKYLEEYRSTKICIQQFADINASKIVSTANRYVWLGTNLINIFNKLIYNLSTLKIISQYNLVVQKTYSNFKSGVSSVDVKPLAIFKLNII